MKILISGICGFAGSSLAHGLLDDDPTLEIVGFDNFSRPGSSLNVAPLQKRGVKLFHADVRAASDLESISTVDWIVDAAANPSVLAGVDGASTSRQLLEHNLYGTVNLLELAKRDRAGFTLLSTSRVYAIPPLADFEVEARDGAFRPALNAKFPRGLSVRGIAEDFSTEPPLSLYGTSKRASELLALEYGETFGFPVWLNRCGVLAGAGQFGRPDQGIFSFWIHAYKQRAPLKYIGFGGEGHQVRDVLHPRDLVQVLRKQMRADGSQPRIVNFGGGSANAMSLAQLSEWCSQRFGAYDIGNDPAPRRFDLPWVVMDCALARDAWDWQPVTPLKSILEEIATHADSHPDWLEISSAL